MPAPVRNMLLATFFFSLMALQIKLLPGIPVWEIVFFRASVTFVICLSLLRYKRIDPRGRNRKVLFLRGLFGTLAMCGVFTTLVHLPLATASTLQKLSPVFAALVSAVAFKERLGWRTWCCYGLAFVGVVLVKGFDPRIDAFYFLVGILAALSAALAYNCIAKLHTTEDPHVIMFYFPMVTLPLIALPTYLNWVPPGPYELAVLLSIGVTVQTAQYFLTCSYQSGQTGTVSIVAYTGIPLAILYDVAIFGQHPTAGSLFGMLLVVAGVVAALWMRRRVGSRG